MTKGRLSLLYSFGVLLWAAGVDVAHAEKKVAICHNPSGHPASARTISVGESATAAHLKHGDQLGECPTGCQANASLCDDGNACTSDTCLSNGQCAHAPVSCDDGNSCTTDLCEASTGCLYLPVNGASCDDGNACTSGDTCTNSACQGNALPGCCTTDTDCDDANNCTTDTCLNNACRNQPLDCAVADKCRAGFCDPGTGSCETTPVNCSDSNVCTDDFCDSVTGCFSQPTTNPPEPVEVSCTDGADNDCDGGADLLDPDCGQPTPISVVAGALTQQQAMHLWYVEPPGGTWSEKASFGGQPGIGHPQFRTLSTGGPLVVAVTGLYGLNPQPVRVALLDSDKVMTQNGGAWPGTPAEMASVLAARPDCVLVDLDTSPPQVWKITGVPAGIKVTILVGAEGILDDPPSIPPPAQAMVANLDQFSPQFQQLVP